MFESYQSASQGAATEWPSPHAVSPIDGDGDDTDDGDADSGTHRWLFDTYARLKQIPSSAAFDSALVAALAWLSSSTAAVGASGGATPRQEQP